MQMTRRNDNALKPSRIETVGRLFATAGVTALALLGGLSVREQMQATAAEQDGAAAAASGDHYAAIIEYTKAAEHYDDIANNMRMFEIICFAISATVAASLIAGDE